MTSVGNGHVFTYLERVTGGCLGFELDARLEHVLLVFHRVLEFVGPAVPVFGDNHHRFLLFQVVLHFLGKLSWVSCIITSVI